ncbi:MAG: helix-turn-helix transcriptional regulator [Bacteroidetes bacterium]|nr:helix-turn-helix transcriptional regulator [Bacteroidota bacterium]MDA1122246.1 helix-turn-helix transcriptional regulator [Bacteroidota bacterium]
MLLSELGEIIKARRDTLRVTQPVLAEMAGISVNTLYKIERGQANPSVKVLNKLAEVMGMELKLEVIKQIPDK